MKKSICLILAFMMLFCLCACDRADDIDTNTTSVNAPSTQPVASSRDAYIGNWVKKNTADADFSASLNLSFDGTGNMCGDTKVKWTFNEAENQIEISVVYSNGTIDTAYPAKIKEDGKLYWSKSFMVQLNSTGELVEVDEIVFDRA